MLEANKLEKYKLKRNFAVTSEPIDGGLTSETLKFVIQKHWASSLHYDFRLELNGVMKSWAIPKGPSFDPTIKRMAIHVEDHPISYADFEGTIPAKQYGAGKVIIWDKGYWLPLGDQNADYAKGNLKFELVGIKLQGKWVLVRIKGKSEKQESWLLIKERDSLAKSSEEFSVIDEYPDSVSEKPFPKSNVSVIEKPRLKESNQTSTILKHAIKANLPDVLKPQLATLTEKMPTDVDNWIYEIKFDGYRLLTKINTNEVKFFTRNGNDWTSKLLFLQQEIAKLNWPSGWYDGEIVMLNEKGIPDFGELQQSLESGKSDRIILYFFDIVYFNGYDLRTIPLLKRRDILKNLFVKNTPDSIRLSEVFEQSPESLLKSACQLSLEGIIAKRTNSFYLGDRSQDWLKLKCKQRQEFVIIGYTPPSGMRSAFGALLLAVYDVQGVLNHVGNVGSGFNQKNLTEIKQKLDAIEDTESWITHKFKAPPKTTWVKPVLLAEVEFGGWTLNGHIRHSVFKGLRMDKNPKTIVREEPKDRFAINGDSSNQQLKKAPCNENYKSQ